MSYRWAKLHGYEGQHLLTHELGETVFRMACNPDLTGAFGTPDYGEKCEQCKDLIMGKGSHRRPIEDKEAWDTNFQRIFGVTKDELDQIAEDTEEPDTVGQDPVVEGEESDM